MSSTYYFTMGDLRKWVVFVKGDYTPLHDMPIFDKHWQKRSDWIQLDVRVFNFPKPIEQSEVSTSLNTLRVEM